VEGRKQGGREGRKGCEQGGGEKEGRDVNKGGGAGEREGSVVNRGGGGGEEWVNGWVMIMLL